jgi:hypothetical protein
MLAAAIAQLAILGLHLVRTARRPERAVRTGAMGDPSMEAR